MREYAKREQVQHISLMEQLCVLLHISIVTLTGHVLGRGLITNFHPDRFAANGKIVIESLCEQGKYYGQYCTGT